MLRVRTVTDLEQCRELWRTTMPTDLFTDQWEVRDCFQRFFQRPPCFIVVEDDSGVGGLLPLSWIEESGCYGYFPGETWHGTTWLEGNRIFVRDGVDPDGLLSRLASAYHLRYLLPDAGSPDEIELVDEIGYLFLPPGYGFDLENYLHEFSGKSRKKLRRELSCLERMRPVWRHDVREDFDLLVNLNLDRFGRDSYFADERFREGLRALADLLDQRGWLRMTTVSLNDEPAAVDMGCLYRGVYTLIAGGTN
ncbi:MAG: GNAT family N-acetyltransferase, partial [Proteobacteria bacterium]|nr:GNAT family N-acetyltransferase [Pseudomonadota bacterium]